jgi:hypothetical protein
VPAPRSHDRPDDSDRLRLCARPGCAQAAAVSLTCDYAARIVFLGPVAPVDPSRYDLCERHSGRFRPPNGWELVRERIPVVVTAGV